MNEILNRMIVTTYEFIETANEMMKSCRLKERKKFSNSRLVISFYLKRAVELTESFLTLLRADKLADSGVLLRSFWEMGINTDFIFSDSKTKETNAIRFLLDEQQQKIRLVKKNKNEFRAGGLRVEERLAELIKDKEKMISFFSKQYEGKNWEWPHISERAANSKQWVIHQAYNQIYAYLCNIEHHDMHLGNNYVDVKRCEPLKKIKPEPLLRPDVNIVMLRSILIVIMKTFNGEFRLKWLDKLNKLEKKQGLEYEELRKWDEGTTKAHEAKEARLNGLMKAEKEFGCFVASPEKRRELRLCEDGPGSIVDNDRRPTDALKATNRTKRSQKRGRID